MAGTKRSTERFAGRRLGEYLPLGILGFLTVAQLGHLNEHVVVAFQTYVLGMPSHERHGLVGNLANVEWVHFAWAWWVLITAGAMLLAFRNNPWLWATVVASAWHGAEHAVTMWRAVTTGVTGQPGLLTEGGLIAGGLPIPREDLHFFYVFIQTVPLVIALVWQFREFRGRNSAKPAADGLVVLAIRSRILGRSDTPAA